MAWDNYSPPNHWQGWKSKEQQFFDGYEDSSERIFNREKREEEFKEVKHVNKYNQKVRDFKLEDLVKDRDNSKKADALIDKSINDPDNMEKHLEGASHEVRALVLKGMSEKVDAENALHDSEQIALDKKAMDLSNDAGYTERWNNLELEMGKLNYKRERGEINDAEYKKAVAAVHQQMDGLHAEQVEFFRENGLQGRVGNLGQAVKTIRGQAYPDQHDPLYNRLFNDDTGIESPYQLRQMWLSGDIDDKTFLAKSAENADAVGRLGGDPSIYDQNYKDVQDKHKNLAESGGLTESQSVLTSDIAGKETPIPYSNFKDVAKAEQAVSGTTRSIERMDDAILDLEVMNAIKGDLEWDKFVLPERDSPEYENMVDQIKLRLDTAGKPAKADAIIRNIDKIYEQHDGRGGISGQVLLESFLIKLQKTEKLNDKILRGIFGGAFGSSDMPKHEREEFKKGNQDVVSTVATAIMKFFGANRSQADIDGLIKRAYAEREGFIDSADQAFAAAVNVLANNMYTGKHAKLGLDHYKADKESNPEVKDMDYNEWKVYTARKALKKKTGYTGEGKATKNFTPTRADEEDKVPNLYGELTPVPGLEGVYQASEDSVLINSDGSYTEVGGSGKKEGSDDPLAGIRSKR